MGKEHENDPQLIVLIGSTALCLTIMLLCLISLVVRMRLWIQTRQININLQRTSIVCMLCFILCSIFDLAHFIVAYIERLSQDIILLAFFADLFYFIGIISVFLLLLARLYFSFENTLFAVQKQTIKTVLCFLLGTITSMIMYLFCLVIPKGWHTNFIFVWMAILVFSQIIISAILSVLFVFKLHQVLMLISQQDFIYYAQRAKGVIKESNSNHRDENDNKDNDRGIFLH